MNHFSPGDEIFSFWKILGAFCLHICSFEIHFLLLILPLNHQISAHQSPPIFPFGCAVSSCRASSCSLWPLLNPLTLLLTRITQCFLSLVSLPLVICVFLLTFFLFYKLPVSRWEYLTLFCFVLSLGLTVSLITALFRKS